MNVLMLLSYPGLTGPAELALSDAVGLRAAGHTVLFGCDTRRDLRAIERAVDDMGRQARAWRTPLIRWRIRTLPAPSTRRAFRG